MFKRDKGRAPMVRPAEEFAAKEVEGQLAIDVYQTPDEIVVESTIAGVEPGDLDIDVTSESVTIKGERRKEMKVTDDDYFYQECFWGRFSRQVILPQEVDPDKANSVIKDGVLTIHLPKIHRDRARKISVKKE
ncbi:MAG: Hsp20/alpha crystallin family protein [Candidatus Colwellbacteria bacterium]|nr:Hsp20/alpha crystallin family protein [Candidatus Colwellbacteria bacterium]